MPKDTICFLIDFDGTIIRKKFNDTIVPSIISILRKENHLDDVYTDKAYQLEHKYRPIESDPNIDFDSKYQSMQEWWNLHSQILIDHKLNIKHIKDACQSTNIVLREGFIEFANQAFEHNIPIIIFSASGIGVESIKFVLQRYEIDFANIHILSNQFIWQDDIAIAIGNNIIHSLNKTFDKLKESEIYKFVENKENAIVIGDSVGDISMGKNSHFNKVVNYGIVNDITDENITKFKKNFDKILLDGESFMKIWNEEVL